MTDRIAARQAEVLRRVLASDRVDLHTALPGEIRSYDAATQTADIVLGLRRVLPAGDDDDADALEDLPILPSVPVLWPRATGAYYLHLPMQAGMGVLVLFCEADYSRWRETGEVSDPGVPARHTLAAPVALPGFHWHGNPNPDAEGAIEDPAGLRLGVEGGPRIDIRGSLIRAGGSQSLALHSPLDAILDAIAADLDTLRTAIGTDPDHAPVPALTLTTVRAANPYATNTLKGS